MKLNDIVKHAYSTVEYYRNIFDKNGITPDMINNECDLSLLPVLKKETIRDNPYSLISNNYDIENLCKEYTSGTSGDSLIVYKSHDDQVRANYSMAKFRLKEYGISPFDKVCYFYMFSRNNDNKLVIDSILKNEKSLSLNIFTSELSTMEKYVRAINEFKPEYVLSIPSYLFIFAKYIKENGFTINCNIKCVELKGEYILDSQIDLIREVFKAPVLNHYGTTETYGIAFSCQNGNLHILKDNVIVEILDENLQPVKDGKEGRVYVTSLSNKAMPLIRYEIDDRAIYQNDTQCECNNRGKCIKILSGRVTEYITLTNKQKINSGKIYYAIEKVNYKYSKIIKHFREIQYDINLFDIHLVLAKDYSDKRLIENVFVSALRDYKLDLAVWRFHYCDYINHNYKKHQYFINLYKGE